MAHPSKKLVSADGDGIEGMYFAIYHIPIRCVGEVSAKIDLNHNNSSRFVSGASGCRSMELLSVDKPYYK